SAKQALKYGAGNTERPCNDRPARRELKANIKLKSQGHWRAEKQATFSAARSKTSDYIPPPPAARRGSAQMPGVYRRLSYWRADRGGARHGGGRMQPRR